MGTGPGPGFWAPALGHQSLAPGAVAKAAKGCATVAAAPHELRAALPAVYDKAYRTGSPVASPLDPVKLAILKSKVPCRSTKASALRAHLYEKMQALRKELDSMNEYQSELKDYIIRGRMQ